LSTVSVSWNSCAVAAKSPLRCQASQDCALVIASNSAPLCFILHCMVETTIKLFLALSQSRGNAETHFTCLHAPVFPLSVVVACWCCCQTNFFFSSQYSSTLINLDQARRRLQTESVVNLTQPLFSLEILIETMEVVSDALLHHAPNSLEVVAGIYHIITDQGT
jgi:hypothetical protein